MVMSILTEGKRFSPCWLPRVLEALIWLYYLPSRHVMCWYLVCARQPRHSYDMQIPPGKHDLQYVDRADTLIPPYISGIYILQPRKKEWGEQRTRNYDAKMGAACQNICPVAIGVRPQDNENGRYAYISNSAWPRKVPGRKSNDKGILARIEGALRSVPTGMNSVLL